jgi:hypothetical protein
MSNGKSTMKKTATIAAIALCGILQSVYGEELSRGFHNPPAAARPWVYWMWLNGNVSKEGITSHLEAMQRIGIGGAMLLNLGVMAGFDLDAPTPGPAIHGSPVAGDGPACDCRSRPPEPADRPE